MEVSIPVGVIVHVIKIHASLEAPTQNRIIPNE